MIELSEFPGPTAQQTSLGSPIPLMHCGCSARVSAPSIVNGTVVSGESEGGVFKLPYKGVPILFDGMVPHNRGEFWAAIIAIFLLSIVLRCLIFLRTYLEAEFWAPAAGKYTTGQVQKFNLLRDLGRAGLTFVTAALGYAIMLVTMTYVAGYFLAVVFGLTVAEFFFARFVGGNAAAAGCCG